MTRRLVPLTLALSFAAVALLGPSVSRGADTAQKVVRVGFIGPDLPSTAPRGVTQFWDRLRELGYVEGQNLAIESRWAASRYDRLPALMAEVLGRNVDVLVTYSTPAGIAAKNATSTIPIVDALMGDPVGTGLAASLARPGGNLTGMSNGWADISGKWLELLQETVPRLSTVAVLENPDTPLIRLAKELQAVAPKHGLKLRIIDAREPGALDQAIKQARQKAQGVLVLPDPMFGAHRGQIASLAAKHRLPAVFFDRRFVEVSGLLSYGPDSIVMFRRAAEYVDKILKGAKPGDLPIEQPTKYELVVNLKTAKALGISIPESILVRADEVIR